MVASTLEFSAFCIIDGYVIATAVLPEMIFHRRISVRNGDVAQFFPSSILSSPEKRFKVNHIVHNGVVATEIRDFARPGQKGAYLWIV